MRKKTKIAVKKLVMVPSPVVVTGFQARIKVLGHIYEATGQTAAKAISNLKPIKGRGVSVLTVIKDGKERSKVLNPIMTMRLFSPSRIAREMSLKNVIGIFSDI